LSRFKASDYIDFLMRREKDPETEPESVTSADQNDEFAVTLRNTSPMLLLNESKGIIKSGDLAVNIATAAVLLAASSVLLMLAEAPELIPFAIAGSVVFVVLRIISEKLGGRTKLISAAVCVVLLAATAIILRKYVWNGFELIMNQLYQVGEEAQAYAYKHFSVGATGEENPEMCMRSAVVWISTAVGVLLSLIPGGHHRGVNTLIVTVTLLITAYYGILPASAGVAAVVITLIISFCSSRLKTMWPLLIAVSLVLGAIIFIDPGEFGPVSRANENLRDIFSMRMANIEGNDPFMEEDMMDDEDDYEEGGFMDSIRDGIEGVGAGVVAAIIAVVILLLILAIALLVHKHLEKKRRKIRAGIDSPEPAVAVGAMFPYAVRWLKAYGIHTENEPFSALVRTVRMETGKTYSGRFEEMLELWKKAVYSDHEITQQDRFDMDRFLKETIDMTKNRADFRDKLKIRFKYAL